MKEEYLSCTWFHRGKFFVLVGSSGRIFVLLMSSRLVYVCFRDREEMLPSEQCPHLTKQEGCQAWQPVQKGLVCVDVAQHLSLQIRLGWVSAAKLTETRKWDSDSSHVGWGSLKCHVSVVPALSGVKRDRVMSAPFLLLPGGADESAQLRHSWLEFKFSNWWGSSRSWTFFKYLRNNILAVQFHSDYVCTKHTQCTHF